MFVAVARSSSASAPAAAERFRCNLQAAVEKPGFAPGFSLLPSGLPPGDFFAPAQDLNVAISLPPPIEPQLVSAADIRAAANIHVGIGALTFHVADRCEVGTAAIETAARAAQTPADFIRGLGTACVQRGYPAARTAYAVEGETLFVAVDRGRISGIDVPPALHGWFEDLSRHRELRSSHLEQARVFADTYSERAGDNYAMRLVPDGADAAKLVIDAATPGRRQIQAQVGFTTSGSRFSGRYLADAQLRLSADTGTELLLGGNLGVRPAGLNEEQNSGPYRDANAQLSQVTTAGVFGVDARYIDFAPAVDATLTDGSVTRLGLDGEIGEAGVSWLNVLYADYNDRLTFNLRISRTHQTLDFEDQRLFTQRYTEGEVTIGTANRFRIGSLDVFELQAAVNLAQGFTTSPFGPGDPAGGQYSLARPALRLSYGPSAWLVPTIELNAQFASKPLPQLEQFVLGGVGSQRAFEPGTASGDNGYAGRLSLSSKRFAWNWASLKPTLFAEYGAAEFRDSLAGRPDGTSQRADVGIETVLRFGSFVEINAYAAASVLRSGPSQLADDDQRLGARVVLSY